MDAANVALSVAHVVGEPAVLAVVAYGEDDIVDRAREGEAAFVVRCHR